MKNTPLVKANNLIKSFGDAKAVNNVSFMLNKGECLALLGDNGAGKTTTCEMLSGLTKPDSGDISICGLNFSKQKKEILEIIGVQLQETHLYKKYTVIETLNLFASFYISAEPVNKILAMLKLEHLKNRRIEALSGGQKQALYIACSLINKPKLVFFDEPTAGLDPHARRLIWELIEDIKREDRGILLTTHYIEEAEHLADRIAFMVKGKIVAEGKSAELIERFCPKEIWGFNLVKDNSKQSHQIEKSKRQLLEYLPWLNSAQETSQGFQIQSQQASKQIEELTLVSSRQNIPFTSLHMRKPKLEDVYLKVTGKAFVE